MLRAGFARQAGIRIPRDTDGARSWLMRIISRPGAMTYVTWPRLLPWAEHLLSLPLHSPRPPDADDDGDAVPLGLGSDRTHDAPIRGGGAFRHALRLVILLA